MSKRKVRDIYPLTPMQQGMLVHALRTPDEPAYYQQYVLAVTGVPDETVLRQAIADLVERHTVLRTGFVWDGVDNPVQVVFAEATVPLTVEDARDVSDVDGLVADRFLAQRRERFDLRRPPLMRAHALRVGDAEWRLITVTHHIVLDGWSTPRLQSDLAELLWARVSGQEPDLPPAAPYREFVAWTREHADDSAAAAHFTRLLGDVRHATPLGMDRVARVNTKAGAAGFVEVRREPAPGKRLDVLARARGVLPSTIVHAAWGLLLARCAGSPDAVFGMTVTGRPVELPGVTERVGQFVNTLPVRVPAAGDLRVGPWLADVQEQLLAAHEFEQTPVAFAQRCSAVPLGEPLYETMVGFHNYFQDEHDDGALPVDAGVIKAGTVSLDVIKQLDETGLPLVLSVALRWGLTWVRLEHDRTRVDREVAEWLVDRFLSLLTELAAADENTRLDDIPLLAEPVPPRRRMARSFDERELPEPVRSAIERLRAGGTSTTTIAEAVDVVSAPPFAADQGVAIALAADEPTLVPIALAALAAGARLEFCDPIRPVDADVVVRPAAAGVTVRDTTGRVWHVHGTADTGGAFACTERIPGAYLVDSNGRPVPDGVAGEVVIAGADGEWRTGMWARTRIDGTMEHLGDEPGSQAVWVARRLKDDGAVAQAVVVGDVAWIVSADGRDVDVEALADRLRKSVPSSLMPQRIRQLSAFPLTTSGRVALAALAGPEPIQRVKPAQPLADRLAKVPAGRREEFLARLRAARHRTRPLRPGRITGPVPRSVQQEFYDQPALRPLTDDTAPASGELSYADYAFWQRDPRRAAEIDRQAAQWREVLRNAPASGLPADRIPLGAPVVGELTRTFPVTGTAGEWLAALAIVLGRSGGDDEVVLGVVTRPVLPAELDGVPGPFERMLPIRVSVSGGRAEVARSAAEAVEAGRSNADVPWPVLRSMLAEDPLVSVAVHERPGILAPHAAATIGIDVAPDGAGTKITAIFDGTRITERTVADLVQRCALVMRTDQPVSAADLVTEDERELLARLGDGGITDDSPATVCEVIAAQAPDAVAVRAVDGDLTYGQLVDKAAGLAAHLKEQGIRAGDRVAVCLPRTTELVWVPLGVMMAGAAYLPVDPAYPLARKQFLCEDAGVSAVVTRGEFVDGVPVIAPDATASPMSVALRPDEAAYVIYTSGSTGQPKGVVVSHESVVDFSRHIAAAYGIGPSDRVLGFAALTFDVSVFELWSTLCAGATLVLASDEDRSSVDRVQRLLVEQRVTVAELPPSLMPLLAPDELPDLRLVSVGGEAPAGVLVDDWATPQREFWNGYGPAETTVAVTLMRCEPPSHGRIPPIGRPMPNHRAYVLDEQQRLVPIGVPGELCIAGNGLALGYLGRPSLTADRFVPDPFEPGRRLYRTGDLARWASDGVLEFLGRVDRQVKIRGYRVEPGEVESVLAADGRIRQVAIEAWDDNGVKHLAAYVVPAGDAPSLAEIRAIAAARLPDYMTPTRLAILDELPRTPSGKIDRRALPAPTGAAVSTKDGAWSELERTIAADVIGPLLRLSEMDREQDFFELGGSSLQAMQVTSRVRDRFGVEIGLADFFTRPTVARLAQLVEQARQGALLREQEVYASVMEAETVLPMSFQQETLYRAEQLGGVNARFHAPFSLRMQGPFDLDAMRQACASLLRRHPALRVSMYRDGDDYVQRVLSSCEVPLEVSDVEGATVEDRLRKVRTLISEEAARGFDLAAGPPIRVRVYRLAPEDHVVQWTVHHIVTDGWSTGILYHEVGTAYHAYADGVEPELAPVKANYGEFVHWHRDYVAGGQYAKDMDWWRGQLQGLSDLALPADRNNEPRPGYLNLRIEPELAAEVQALGAKAGTSLYMTTLAAYATVLAAHAGHDDIAVVTPHALRVRSAWENLIGWFVNPVLVRLRVDSSTTFADLLRATRTMTSAAFVRHAMPFEHMRSELKLPDGALAACFSLQNVPESGAGFRRAKFDLEMVRDDSGLDFAPIGAVYAPLGLQYASAVSVRERDDGSVAGGWEYDAGRFTEDTARRWSAGLLDVLAHAAAKPDIPVRELRRIALGS